MFILLEIQANSEGVPAIVPPVAYNSESVAYQAYYTALAAASVSSVYAHTVILMNSEGDQIEKKTVHHW